MSIERFNENPILTPASVKATADHLEVAAVINPAAVQVGGDTILLVRVCERAREQDDEHLSSVIFDSAEQRVKIVKAPKDHPELVEVSANSYRYKGRTLLTSMSHLRVARSSDGTHFRFDAKPAIFPSNPYEAFGCEEARITFLDGWYYITYAAVSDRGVVTALARTNDFEQFHKLGILLPPNQRDAYLFPRKVRGMFVCRERPARSELNMPCVWTAYSPDLFSWGRYHMTLSPRGDMWDESFVGGGAPPVRIEQGWLEVYNGVDRHGKCSLGVIISELEYPEQVLWRSPHPLLGPAEPCENHGLRPGSVFCNGMVAREGGKLSLYYGAGGSTVATATTSAEELISLARASEPATAGK
ncbi:MAG: hypothetical protein EHM48_01010 [Planctomycetaceae bacterium]|nr:MAG: hypothetical protein EHM48_01010 [Planctomycetaceae bacterium]